MAATQDLYQRKHRDTEQLSIPVAASTRIYQNTIVCKSATGFAVGGADTAGLKVVGIATTPGDNSGGADGDINVRVRRGKRETFKCTGASQAWLYENVYVVDNETVAATTTNSVLAGIVASVNSATEVEVFVTEV